MTTQALTTNFLSQTLDFIEKDSKHRIPELRKIRD